MTRVQNFSGISETLSKMINPGRGGVEKHKIYADAFGSHLFYNLFLQDRGGATLAPVDPLLFT